LIYNLSQNELCSYLWIHRWKPWKRVNLTFQVSS
jgi:hypothetical protein